MKVTFLGANHEVTGSCTLIEINGRNVLVDCGMEQGADTFVNAELPVNPGEIECVLLTHAHIDHSGKLPLLYKNGFRGPVYATSATCNLSQIMLMDAAQIQEAEAEWRTRKAKRSGGEGCEPMYTVDDAQGVISKLRPCNYGERIRVLEGMDVRFNDVGHLLGSAAIEIWLSEGGTDRKIVFSGDVGNVNQPIIKDPQPVAECDWLVVESTYGDRLHEEEGANNVAILRDCIKTALDAGGNVLIPSFAVGRTQEILYFIRRIKEENMLPEHPDFPVYVDSPLALEATDVFMQCDHACFDDETLALVNSGVNPVWFEGLHVAVSAEESKAINLDPTPKVIISASGMCEAGRIRHHLKHNLWRKESMLLFVGYQANGTLGRIIYDGAKKVKLFGEEIAVNCGVSLLPGISGHADKNGLIAWIKGFRRGPEHIFVNHGDDGSCVAFAETLKELGYDAEAPFSGSVFDLRDASAIVRTEGKPVRKDGVKNAVFAKLLAAAERLMKALRGCEGRSNRELSALTDKVNALADDVDRRTD